MITLAEKLRKAMCPYGLFPAVLETKKFSAQFKVNISSHLYPTLSEALKQKGSIVCVNTFDGTDLTMFSGFGYLYTYCIDKGLPDGLLPKYITREEVKDALDLREYDTVYTRATLFIDFVDMDEGMYTREDIRVFSNFVYQRSLKGYSTVLCFAHPIAVCSDLTPFLKGYLMNLSTMVSVKE